MTEGAARPTQGSAALLSFRSFLLRRRGSLSELGILLAGLLVFLYIAFEVDVFANEDARTVYQFRIELDEALLLGGLLAVGLLVFAIRRFHEARRETARRAVAERRSRELAYQDALTGLPNRRQFTDALLVAVASPPQSGGVHAVLMLDLNGFKQINDTYGHGIGDEVLVLVSQRLLQAVREGDLVARLGGDEFTVLAKNLLGSEAAANIALRIIRLLADPIVIGKIGHPVGAGIGICLVPEDADSEDEALRKADLALYRAKAERRSAFRFFEPDMDRLVHEREALERALRAAIEDGSIGPRFRPAFDLRSGRVVSFEAVPYWVTPAGAEIAPERFLPLAEDSGIVHGLAELVLAKACRAAAEWPLDVTLSIDLFPGQLKNPDLAESILATCRKAGFDRRRLELEIAESTIVRDLDAAKRVLAPLRQAGVRVALDHFGTGYSNLYHMQELRLDRVKIDRRFVQNMGEEEAGRIVRALAGLGQGLGIAVTADGVPGPTAGSDLVTSGVDVGQSSGALVSEAEARGFFGPASA